MKDVLRSVLAVLAGATTTVVLVLLVTYLAILLLLPPSPDGIPPYATPAFVVAGLASSMASGVAGGWVTATLARRRGPLHGAGMGTLLIFPILLNRGVPGPGQPGWYAWAFGGAVLMGAVAGAVMQERVRGSAAPSPT